MANNPKLLPNEMTDAYICKSLKLTEKQLNETSDEWVLHSLLLYGVEAEINEKRQKEAK